ncbi:MAG: ACP S-malonyltransferase [Thermodesulfobacteriota bacterium]
MKRIAALFPGQGSQYIGMAAEFLAAGDGAGAVFDRAEAMSGLPLRKLCLEGPMEELTRTLHLQPAVTVVNIVALEYLKARGFEFVCAAGHSLGEYSALYAVGVVGLDDLFRLVTERGILMEREAARNPGAMAALVGLGLGSVEELVARVPGRVCAANHNNHHQVVISGERDSVAAVCELAAAAGAKAIPLKVSGAWHSPLVAGAIDDFAGFMAAVPFRSPQLPVFFNVTGEAESDPQVIRGMMAAQISSMVRWVDIVQRLIDEQIEVVVEIGPKNVLSGLVKKILPADRHMEVHQVDTPAKADKLLAELGG